MKSIKTKGLDGTEYELESAYPFLDDKSKPDRLILPLSSLGIGTKLNMNNELSEYGDNIIVYYLD